MEETVVEVVEDFFEMIMMAAGGVDVLASAKLADEVGFRGEVAAGDVAAVAGAVRAIDRLAIEFGEQDVRDRMEDGFWRGFEKIGEADVKFALAEPYGVVDGDKRIEADVHRRRGRARAEFGISGEEDFREAWRHGELRVAEEQVLRVRCWVVGNAYSAAG